MIMRPSPKWMQTFSVLMIGLGLGLIGTSYFVRIEEVVTAQGILKAEGGREDVKSPVGGKIKEIYVTNGDRVQKGDMLLKFDTTLAQNDVEKYNKLIALEKKSLTGIQETISIKQDTLTRRLQTQNEILRGYEELNKVGGIARIEYLKTKDQVYDLKNKLSELKEQKIATGISSQKQIRAYKANLQSAQLQLTYQNVVADSNGIIFDLQVRDEGVLQGGATILALSQQVV